jgi:hypothetical protein
LNVSRLHRDAPKYLMCEFIAETYLREGFASDIPNKIQNGISFIQLRNSAHARSLWEMTTTPSPNHSKNVPL